MVWSRHMASMPMICPKCQQPIEPYQFTFSTIDGVITLQKCPTCDYEWRNSSRSADARNREEQKATGT